MATRYEVEVTVVSARKLKNVNWRHGDLRPYVVLWVDAAAKCSTKIAVGGDSDGEDPLWDEKLTLVLPPGCSLDAAALFLDVVHANAVEGTKPLIGSGRLPLRELVDEAGLGATASRTIKLKRPSGRPQGKIEVKIAVREPARHRDLPPPGTGGYAPPYGQQSRDFGYGYSPYPAPPPTSGGYPYAAAPPPSGYSPYGAPPPTAAGYGQPSAYGAPPYGAATEEGKKKGKFGMGTGLAVGAAAGLLGGLAIAEGVDYVGDKIADDAAHKVEADLGYGDDF